MKTIAVDQMTCSKYDPEVGDVHGPGQWLVRWTREPFENYPWVFCTDCKDELLEDNAVLIAEL